MKPVRYGVLFMHPVRWNVRDGNATALVVEAHWSGVRYKSCTKQRVLITADSGIPFEPVNTAMIAGYQRTS